MPMLKNLVKILIILSFPFNAVFAADIPIIVIAPSKKAQSVSTVGTSVVIYDENNINSSTDYFLGDVLNFGSPSLNGYQSGGYGTTSGIQLRGIPKRYSTVYIDGVKMSDPSTVSNDYYFDDLLKSQISRIEIADLYHHYLFADHFRSSDPYTYFPDINGDFVVRTLQGDDHSREAEYSLVHFALPYDPILNLDEVYIFGKFNNYALTDENKLIYNEGNGMMEGTIKMKQGFYNYKYVIKKEDGTVDLNSVGGNFHFTENNYLILVYYRNFGELYDSIIGIGNANSRDISN